MSMLLSLYHTIGVSGLILTIVILLLLFTPIGFSSISRRYIGKPFANSLSEGLAFVLVPLVAFLAFILMFIIVHHMFHS